MQQQSGGWLPTGFTELEYLQGSGTQYIEVPEPFDEESGVYVSADYTETTLAYDYVWGVEATNNYRLWQGCRAVTQMSVGLSTYQNTGLDVNLTRTGTIAEFWTNWLKSNKLALQLGDYYGSADVSVPLALWQLTKQSLFATINAKEQISIEGAGTKIKAAKFSQGSEITRDFVPVLDASGTPCMFDKVSRQCFYNAGEGTFGYRVKTAEGGSSTFSLRDPYYTAPSGIYARLAGENELEILADTEEPQGEGWEWFANTGEAYEHFGIVPDEELLTNNDTDHE